MSMLQGDAIHTTYIRLPVTLAQPPISILSELFNCMQQVIIRMSMLDLWHLAWLTVGRLHA